MRRGTSVAASVLLIIQGCTSTPGAENNHSVDEPTCYSGVLALLPAPKPLPVIVTQDFRLLLIEGEAQVPESLERATLEVCGNVEEVEERGTRRMTVDSFDLLAIDGQPALIGTLAHREDQLVLVRGESSWRLTGPIGDLMNREGDRVWVTGRIQDGHIEVTSYGLVP